MPPRQIFPPVSHYQTSEYRGRTGQILERLQELHPVLIDLSLERLEILLARLGHPERNLPPVIHVAGTNGKGSTCANLRAIAEEAGLRAHVMTSPHLLSVTERFRLAGRLVSEEQLVTVLEEIEAVNQGAAITVFEVLTAAGFLLFSRHPADLAIIEVGLGGRFDATNLIPAPKACIITSISLDHQAFLGNHPTDIAREKAGIIKRNVPVITCQQDPDVLAVLQEEADRKNAPLYSIGQEIHFAPTEQGFSYRDPLGILSLPKPALEGEHQISNAALAIAALRLGKAGLFGKPLPECAFHGITKTSWPARLQPLSGHLRAILPENWSLILDGGHNPGAGEALAKLFEIWRAETPARPLHLVIGLKESKDASGFLRPLLPYASTIYAVAEEAQHLAMTVADIQQAARKAGGNALAGPVLKQALQHLAETAEKERQKTGHSALAPARVLICGSLYLAGCALAQDGYQNAG